MASQQASDNPYKAAGNVIFDESRIFSGVQLWLNPQDTNGSMLTYASNVVNIAGELWVRPGRVGLFGGNAPSSSSSSSAISSSSGVSSSSGDWNDTGQTYYGLPPAASYKVCDFEDGFGTMWLLFASNGRLFKTVQESASYTELLNTSRAPYAFNSQNLYGARLGNFVYLVDGQSPVTRVDLTGGFPAYPMIAPTGIPGAMLTNAVLFQANNASNWNFDGQATPYPNVFPFGNFESYPSGLKWDVTGQMGPANGQDVNMIASAVNVCLNDGTAVDNTGSFLAIAALSGSVAETPPLYPSRFHLLVTGQKDGAFHGQGNSYSAVAVITAFDTNKNTLGQQRFTINPAQGTTETYDFIADFSGVGPIVAFIKAQFIQGSNSNSGNLWISNPFFYPISVQTTFVTGVSSVIVYPSLSGGAITTSSSSSASSASGGSSSSSSSGNGSVIAGGGTTDLGTTLDYEGTSFTFTFPISSSSSSSMSGGSSSSGGLVGGIDLSGTDRLVIALTANSIASWVNLGFNLYLIQVGGAQILADNGTTVDSNDNGIDCDISTLTTAQRQNIVGIRLQFQNNIAWQSPYYALQLGPITLGGNLTVGDANYTWYVTETAVIDSQNQIQGNPSPPSNPLAPSFFQAEGLITLPADSPINAQTNQYSFYRLGGVWSDVRLIAAVSSTVAVAYGSDPTNPYYSWNPITRVFLDNTPDSWLDLATLLSFTLDPMPPNAQANAAWQGRYCEAVENIIYISRLAAADNSAALQTTLVNDVDDPSLELEGGFFPVSPDPSDTILALIPFGTPIEAGNAFGGGLLILNKRSVWMLSGTGPSSWSLRQYDYGLGVGLIAQKGWARISANQVTFMGPDRLHQFPPNLDSVAKDIGLAIQPAIYPITANGTLQNQTAFSLSWMAFHNYRLYMGCPMPGNTQNTIIWLYDFRTGGWTSWASMNITSAMSEPPNAQGAQNDLFLFGQTNVYLMAGTVDVETPISAPVAISFVVTSHANRPGFFYRYKLRPIYYNWCRLEWAEFEIILNGTVTVMALAFSQGPTGTPTPIAGAKSIQTYELGALGRPFRMDMPSGLIEGQMVFVTVSGSATQTAFIRGVRGYISTTNVEAN